jgi:uncharacterized membrane protein YeaQ/YmgE (transglycosylase-associated protein family)
MEWLWDVIIWIALGAIAGWLAGLIMGNRGNLVMNVIVGIIGAFIGGLIMGWFFGEPGATGLDWWSIFVAVIGAVVLLAIVNLFSGRGVRA